jgi:Zn-dependent M28 family amino/carboxypeptidase
VEKVRAAAAHGAVALVSVTTPAFEQALPWARMVALSRMQRLRWVGEQAADLQAVAVLGRAASEALFARGPRRLAEVLAQPRAPRGFVLPATLEATTASTHAEVRSANVAAVLRGTHPARAREHVVLSAHLDHLGQGPAEEGDAVYNGAMDNALGVAVLMEAARALAGGGPRSRSVVFLASTAEESGLLGADYFARHPPVPAESLVANVNLEGIGLLFPLREVVGVGSRVSSLGEDLEAAAREVGVRVGREQGPSGGLFERSDHYAFARQGIPALMVIAGSQAGDGGPEGAARQLAWMADHYHRPSDDVRQAIDYGAAARLGEVAAALVARVAGDTARPEWKRGSFAAAAFGGKG